MSALLRRILLVLTIALLVAAAAGCDEVDKEVDAAIKDKTGLDAKDPMQMAGAALGSTAIGSKDEQDAVDLVRTLRRTEHEEKADQLANKKDYPKAIEELDQALSWNLGKDPIKTGELYLKQRLYYKELGDEAKAEEARQKALEAWGSAEKAARAQESQATTYDRGEVWAKLASRYYAAHAIKQACDAAKKAMDLNGLYEDYWTTMHCDTP
jgi:tetratricopeptide (TPR) repeat protein